MKKLSLLLINLMSVAIASASNYFVPGTVWEYNIFNIVYFENRTIRLEPLEETESDGGKIYRTIMHETFTDRSGNPLPDQETTIEGNLIKVDGNKVYEKVISMGKADWQLIYDFSLKLGEGCLIKETAYSSFGYNSDPQEEGCFKYVEDSYLDKYDATAMVLKVFRSFEDSIDENKAIRTYYWIPGVGSVDYFDGAYYFPLIQVDGGLPYPSLTKVTDAEGNVIVEYRAPAGIQAVEAADADAPAGYYDLQGRRVANPGHGLYVLRQGAKATKVIF